MKKDTFTLVMTGSLKAYDQILEALGNTYFDFSISKKYKIEDKGYIYFEFDNKRIDAYTVPSIEYLYDEVHTLQQVGEQAVINVIQT